MRLHSGEVSIEDRRCDVGAEEESVGCPDLTQQLAGGDGSPLWRIRRDHGRALERDREEINAGK